jgi:hypothetical protein
MYSLGQKLVVHLTIILERFNIRETTMMFEALFWDALPLLLWCIDGIISSLNRRWCWLIFSSQTS